MKITKITGRRHNCLRFSEPYLSFYAFSMVERITLKINGTQIEIPVSYGVMRVQNIGCKLPAGTTEITIEATGKPGIVFGIRNLSIFQ